MSYRHDFIVICVLVCVFSTLYVDKKVNNVYKMSMVYETKLTPRTTRKREKRIERILDTAIDLVSREGIDGFSLHKLAGELDLTVGALYRYFPSKMALIGALEIRVIRLFADEFDDANERFGALQIDCEPSVKCIARILLLCDVYRQSCRQNPARMTLIGNILASPNPVLDQDVAQGVMQEMLHTLSFVAGAIAEAQSLGLLTDGLPLQRAVLVWTSARGVIHIEKLERHDGSLFNSDVLYRGILNTLLAGWGAPKSLLDDAHTIRKKYMEVVYA